MPKIISRSEALEKNLKYYYTGKPCKHGHLSKRHARYRYCLKCASIDSLKRRTPEQSKKAYEKYKKNNYEKLANRRRIQSRIMRQNPEFRAKQIKFFQKWRNENPDYFKKYNENNKISGKSKEWYQNNKHNVAERQKKYRLINKDRIKRYNNLYWKTHRYEHNKYIRDRKKIDPIFKLTTIVRSRMGAYIKKNEIRKTNKTFEFVGCTPKELKQYLEKKFKSGMSWKNHSLKGWHIDHIKPLSLAKNFDEVMKLCHYTNLQPLWADENIKKKDKY